MPRQFKITVGYEDNTYDVVGYWYIGGGNEESGFKIRCGSDTPEELRDRLAGLYQDGRAIQEAIGWAGATVEEFEEPSNVEDIEL
jgi:hypothetical protein